MGTSHLLERLRKADENHRRIYPGPSDARQPVHTVYGGAHLFRPDTARRLGDLALTSLDRYAPDPDTFATVLGVPVDMAGGIYERVRTKLEVEPVEDFRIDFEDGYGNRPDEEEDGHAVAAATAVAQGARAGTLPPFIGIRVKQLRPDLAPRALRTLELFMRTIAQELGEALSGLRLTVPKVVSAEQAAVFADALGGLEAELGLSPLHFEVMIETPQSIIGPQGALAIRELVAAGGNRCIAAHFGTYDYTASLDISAEHQHMLHPACDWARLAMQAALAGTGIELSDGGTNIMPVGQHHGDSLTDSQLAENRAVVHDAWRLHYRHVRHSLKHAFYQGWDLHPAQLPTRYAAVYSFFLESLDRAAERLSTFVAQAAQATLVGDVFDDAATGQGLLNYFLRAINSGAVTEQQACDLSGLTIEELRSRSFVEILRGRQAGSDAP